MLKIAGFDSALIGIATVWQKSGPNSTDRVDTLVYDGDAILATLMHESGLSYEEAEEYISFNIEGAYVGEATPIIVWSCKMARVDMILESQRELEEGNDE
jgi:hypothetical protein